MSEADTVPFDHVLAKAPIGMMILQRGRVVWANESLFEILRLPREDLLDLTESAAAARGLSALFDAEAGALEWPLAGGETRHLFRYQASLSSDGWEAHYLQDVSETHDLGAELESLKAQIKLLDTRDPETGLLNDKAILQALESQISRTRRYGNPLSAIRLSLVPPTDDGEHHITLAAISQEFRIQLRWADQIGRLDISTFLLVLPETNFEDAKALAEKLETDRMALASRAEGWQIGISVTAWQKGDDTRKLLNRLVKGGSEPPA